MLLMNLRNVPEEEAEEVRALLDENGIEYYETQPSLMGFACGALWAHRKEQVPEAKRLLEAYQRDLQQRMRAQYDQALREGTAETLATSFRRHPLRMLAALGGAGFLLFVSLMPFIALMEG